MGATFFSHAPCMDRHLRASCGPPPGLVDPDVGSPERLETSGNPQGSVDRHVSDGSVDSQEDVKKDMLGGPFQR